MIHSNVHMVDVNKTIMGKQNVNVRNVQQYILITIQYVVIMVLLTRTFSQIIYFPFSRMFIFISFRSKCHLEYDACTRHLNIEPIHMGQCNNCHNVTCSFNGQCRSEQGNYTCVCPSRNTCPPVRVCFLFSSCLT